MIKLIYYLLVFSLLGYLWEVLLYLLTKKAFVNRGFLHIPFIPMYGFGSLVLIYLSNIINNKWIFFLLSIILCGSLEYITGIILMKLYKTRWWDYRKEILNINGYVCIKSATFFGIISIILVKYLLPKINNLYTILNSKLFVIILLTIFLTFLFDYLYSLLKPNKGKYISFL